VAKPARRTGYFPRAAVWTRDISRAPVDGQSKAVIAWLDKAGGWGLGRMQIDFSIHVLRADASTPKRTFQKTGEFYTPDCDHAPVPVPAGGALEGESGYQCTGGGDCHLIVVDQSTRTLYELWRADIRGDVFKGGCMATWKLDKVYPAEGRGMDCTSADAAGLPIAPLLFTADEVAAGKIDHAIRFILPNKRIRNKTYVAPATHATGAAKGGSSAPPYGARLRLRADFPLDTLPNDGARTVARAMQKYGVILADGGRVALTAQSDRDTKAKWSGLLGSRDLASIKVTDFDMIEAGKRHRWTGDCKRTGK
jgi:serine/threonine-protein kinase